MANDITQQKSNYQVNLPNPPKTLKLLVMAQMIKANLVVVVSYLLRAMIGEYLETKISFPIPPETGNAKSKPRIRSFESLNRGACDSS